MTANNVSACSRLSQLAGRRLENVYYSAHTDEPAETR